MKPSKSSKNCIPLYCDLPVSQTQLNPEDDIWYFPPARERESTPPTPDVSSRSGPRVAQECSQLQIFSKDEPAASRGHPMRQANTGLGQTNLVNVVSTVAPVKRAEVIPIIHTKSL